MTPAWGTEGQCNKCKAKAFWQHVRMENVFNSPKVQCHCGGIYVLRVRGYNPNDGVREIVPPQPGDNPGAHLTVENWERCNLTEAQERDSTRLLQLAWEGSDGW